MSAAKKPRRTLLFDTLAYVKKLEESGIPQKQAEAQVRLFSEVLEENICSKQDVLETEGRLEVKLKETEGRLEVKIKDLELKIENVRKDLMLEIGHVKVEVEKSKSEIIKWFIGTFFVSIGLMMGFATLLFRLSH